MAGMPIDTGAGQGGSALFFANALNGMGLTNAKVLAAARARDVLLGRPVPAGATTGPIAASCATYAALPATFWPMSFPRACFFSSGRSAAGWRCGS